MRNLVFCFDGTRNGRDDHIPTNVLRMHRAMGLPDQNQTSFYFAGPGNEDETNFFGEIFGGAFGVGSSQIRDSAMMALGSVYRPGDRIAAIGFSRGASVARMFCGKLGRDGVNGEWPRVAFLGCFDTVGAFLPFGKGQQGTLFHDLTVSPFVDHAYHAVALDEIRDAFEPNLMNHRKTVTEEWFPGGHCDVGGGNPDSGLSDCALDWMIGRAREHSIAVGPIDMAPSWSAPMTQETMLRNSPRRVGVKFDGKWSDDLKPVFSRAALNRRGDDPGYRIDLDMDY